MSRRTARAILVLLGLLVLTLLAVFAPLALASLGIAALIMVGLYAIAYLLTAAFGPDGW